MFFKLSKNKKNFTFRISFIISAGSIELVVFIDHVKRSERGFISPTAPPPPPLPPTAILSLVVGPVILVVILVLFKSAGRRYDDDDDALAILPVILFPIGFPVVPVVV